MFKKYSSRFNHTKERARQSVRTETLICCLGNPIGGDDSIGCVIGRRLKKAFADKGVKVIPEYTGSALDFVLDICGWQKVFIIDAIISDKMPPGSVRLFAESEICKKMKAGCFHGVNLPRALMMARKLKLGLPPSVKLIGIEIKPVTTFGEKLSPALKERLPEIHSDVARIFARELIE